MAFEEQWERLADRNAQPDLMGEFGVLTSPDYIRLIGPAYHFKSLLPVESLDEMDEGVMQDLYMWSAGMARAQWVWDAAHADDKSGQ